MPGLYRIALKIAAVVGVTTAANAQAGNESVRRESPVQRGSVQVAGTASFQRTHDIGNDHGWVTLELTPRVGLFVMRGLAVNLNVRHRQIWFDDQATVREQHFNEWGIGPGLTYYVTTKSPRLFPFISGRTLFVRSVNETDLYVSADLPEPTVNDRKARTRTTNWQVSGGVMYMLVKHVGLTSEVFYQRTRTTIQPDTPEEATNSAKLYGIQWGLAAFIF